MAAQLALIGLVAANAAISFGTKAMSQRGVAGLESAQIQLQAEQAKLEAEQKALALTRQFRETMSYNVALAAMGIGSDTGLRGVLSESASNLKEDLKVLDRSKRYVDLQATVNRALSGQKGFVSGVKAAQQTGIESLNLAKTLGLFGG